MNKHSLCSQEFWGQQFPGGPAVNSLNLHCRGLGFDPWTGYSDLACHVAKKIEVRRHWHLALLPCSSPALRLLDHGVCSQPEPANCGAAELMSSSQAQVSLHLG